MAEEGWLLRLREPEGRGCATADDAEDDSGDDVHHYRVTHRTDYRYGCSVTAGESVARLRPRSLPHQQVLAAAVVVDPTPTTHDRFRDAFGNEVDRVTVDPPHDRLTITATSEVQIARRALPTVGWDEPWEHTVAATGDDPSPDGRLARRCRVDSELVVRHPDLAAFAAGELTPGRPLGEAVTGLCRMISRDVAYVSGVTDVGTPATEVLARRQGVCQDFAHLLLGALRSQGLGARYVSGYIESDTSPDTARLVGAAASHAWVGLYVPGHGWVDLDPTNGLVQPDRHVTVAWGRDYTDVVPVRGAFRGPPSCHQQLTVTVDVVPLSTP
jgi:transglutaminase-like putative cysteine protease